MMKTRKTLHLNLKKKWFDMILSGEKKEEYRAITEYWLRRFFKDAKFVYNTSFNIGYLTSSNTRDFETITFSNGYQKDRPQFEIEFKKLRLGKGLEKWGADSQEQYFIFELGEILSKTNCPEMEKDTSAFDEFKDSLSEDSEIRHNQLTELLENTYNDIVKDKGECNSDDLVLELCRSLGLPYGDYLRLSVWSLMNLD